jgi:starvation-inducible DNA-binding protein
MAVESKRRSPETMKTIERELSVENTAESPVVQSLRRQVANAVVLYFNYKHYHWQSYGPLFRDLHKLFDGFAKDVLETLDPLAERVRMIGQNPPANPLEAADLASVPQAAPHGTMREMVEEADRNLLIVVNEMRSAANSRMCTAIRAQSTSSRGLFKLTRGMSGGCGTCCARETDSARSWYSRQWRSTPGGAPLSR